jgi:hypothetical protein
MSVRDEITARPGGVTDVNGHRRSSWYVLDDDARPSWFAYGFERNARIGPQQTRKRRRR